MMIRIGLLFVVISLASVHVNAQTACPSGVTPGSAQCGPSPEYHGISGNSGAVQSAPRPIIIKTKWVDRWGAVAVDGDAGSLGAAERMKNKKQAEKSAISKCVKNGGKQCVLNLSYANQCVAMVNGANNYYIQLGSSAEIAAKNSQKKCMDNDKGCHIYYSACSMAERIR